MVLQLRQSSLSVEVLDSGLRILNLRSGFILGLRVSDEGLSLEHRSECV